MLTDEAKHGGKDQIEEIVRIAAEGANAALLLRSSGGIRAGRILLERRSCAVEIAAAFELQ